MNFDNVVIVHGFLAAPNRHWFPWLKGQYERLNTSVIVPEMPESHAPSPHLWQERLQQSIPNPNERTLFIGHSLGCIATLRYIASLPDDVTIGGVVLISGFSEKLPTLPELSAFTDVSLDFRLLIQKIERRVAILSLNDEIVPPQFTLDLSQQLCAELYGFPDGGHFLDDDGFTTFSNLEKVLKDNSML
ncbi:RBBP9/YdeN family alpha/beta hydrolase [Photorhabdus khanii]|uniref:Serine hydrolase family protein n=1 Tax=Photorhabdus khanii subsp. guanajuatensis TaxID=2100166 RepID=A0A4R4K4J0_9GAMM|nr:alpha/beta hydrolase [Photorhabdus khanii]TDB62173.1 serine hydrolase family protein [Photorhabdus khanii subsp. guanajuatensis]